MDYDTDWLMGSTVLLLEDDSIIWIDDDGWDIHDSWMKLKNVPLGLRPEGFYGQLQMRMIFEEFSITKEEDAIIVNAVYDRIEKAEIWIPYGEVLKHYRSIKVKLCRRIRSGADAGGKIHNQHPNQRVKFMNSNSLTARGVWQRLTR